MKNEEESEISTNATNTSNLSINKNTTNNNN
jgi:hypothetical protein